VPTLRKDMSVGLRGDEMGSDDIDEDCLEIVFGISVTELRERAFGEELAVVDDADDVAELLDFAHDVGGEDDGLAVVAAFADKRSDGAGGHDVEAVGGLVKDHDGWIVHEGAGNGSFLLHAGGELVASAIAEAVHVQAVEDVVEKLF